MKNEILECIPKVELFSSTGRTEQWRDVDPHGRDIRLATFGRIDRRCLTDGAPGLFSKTREKLIQFCPEAYGKSRGLWFCFVLNNIILMGLDS